jgi:hypothetical protein
LNFNDLGCKQRKEDFIIVAGDKNEAKIAMRLLCENSEVLLELFWHVGNFCRRGEVSIELFPKSGQEEAREHDLRLPSWPARTRNDETIVNNALSKR